MHGFNQLSIPLPCTESWAAMSPAADGRFCGQCRKTVVDFSAFTDAELLAWLKDYKGGACGRFRTGQLQRPLVPPRRRWPALRAFFTITLPAFLLSLKAGANIRSPAPFPVIALRQGPAAAPVSDTLPAPTTVRGTVRGQDGEPIPFAYVTEKGTRNQVVADSSGNFTLTLHYGMTIAASASGYTAALHTFRPGVNTAFLALRKDVLMGDIVLLSYAPVKKTRRQLRRERRDARHQKPAE
ncbi:MAG: hypothetical protein EOP50_10295 [Sphingobacteriales bacterium]|nr:MAG: hypothetical protein EOP50_10295 [Sphingobacteriales bacterium]